MPLKSNDMGKVTASLLTISLLKEGMVLTKKDLEAIDNILGSTLDVVKKSFTPFETTIKFNDDGTADYDKKFIKEVALNPTWN